MFPDETPAILLDRIARLGYPRTWHTLTNATYWVTLLGGVACAGLLVAMTTPRSADARSRSTVVAGALLLLGLLTPPVVGVQRRAALRAEVARLVAVPGVRISHGIGRIERAAGRTDTLWTVRYVLPPTPDHPTRTVTPPGLVDRDVVSARLAAMLSRQMVGGPALELQVR